MGKVKTLTRPYPFLPIEHTRAEVVVVSDWVESVFSWLGGVFGFSSVSPSWEERPTQSSWKYAVSMLWRTMISDLVHSPPDFGSYLATRAGFPKRADQNTPARPSAAFFEYFSAWVKQFRLIQENYRDGRPVDTSTRAYQDIEALSHEWLIQMGPTAGRRLGALHCKRLALLPGNARVGDEVWILSGVKLPFVVRRKGAHYQLVGSCYLHGMMDGQAVGKGDWRLQEILNE